MSQRPVFFLRALLLCLCSFCLLPALFSSSTLAAGYARTSISHPQASTDIRQAVTLPVSHSSIRNSRSSSDPIAVISETYTLHFPNYIDFTLTASDAQSAINAATITIQFKDAAFSQNTEQHVVRTNSPARVITLRWHEDTSGDNFHYPGTPGQYYWALQDQANNQYIDKGSNFITLDTRFIWQHASQGLLHVYWYNRPPEFGQTLLTKAQASITHISRVLGAGLLHAINVWVYASNNDFHGALAPGAYEWIGGEAHPDLNEAFISAVDDQDDTLVRDMPHELSHLVLHQLVAQGLGDFVPRWFDEGMAVYNQFYHEPKMTFHLDQALSRHDLLRLDDIAAQFPANGDTVDLAYAQSWNLIDYMYKTFGQAKMTSLIQKMNNSQTDFSDDLTSALGEDQLHLENQWHLQLNQPPVLTADQVTPTPKPSVHNISPQTMPVDNTAPLLITLGGALILLPILALAALLLYLRCKSQRERAVQYAWQVASRPGPYMSFAYGMSENPYEGPVKGEMPRIVQPEPAAPTPWQFEYPPSSTQGFAGGGPAGGSVNFEERRDAPLE